MDSAVTGITQERRKWHKKVGGFVVEICLFDFEGGFDFGGEELFELKPRY